jgi:mannose-1-phosphate guanylyltransferase
MGTKVPKETANRYGCLVADPQTNEVLHYVDKRGFGGLLESGERKYCKLTRLFTAETFVSDVISCGVYLFDRTIFRELAKAVAERRARYEKELAEEPFTFSSVGSLTPSDVDLVQLENDVLRNIAGNGRLHVFMIGQSDFWMQIKAAASALPANALYLQHWAQTNPSKLARKPSTFAMAHMASALPQHRPADLSREGSGFTTLPDPQQLTPESPEPAYVTDSIPATISSPVRPPRTEPELIQPVFIHPSVVIHPSAKIGPNVFLAERVVIGRGVRIRDAIILDNVEVKHDSIVLNSVIGKDSRIGCWSRVEGSPVDMHSAATSGGATVNGVKAPGATVFGTEVKVGDEVAIRNCIVLPHKELKGLVPCEIGLAEVELTFCFFLQQLLRRDPDVVCMGRLIKLANSRCHTRKNPNFPIPLNHSMPLGPDISIVTSAVRN